MLIPLLIAFQIVYCGSAHYADFGTWKNRVMLSICVSETTYFKHTQPMQIFPTDTVTVSGNIPVWTIFVAIFKSFLDD